MYANKHKSSEQAKPVLDKSHMFGKKKWSDPIMKIRPEVQKVLDEWDFKIPSKIQSFSIPGIVTDPPSNLIAQSQNGSGKTLAYSIGSIARIDDKKSATQVVIITPTRELCRQIYKVYQDLTKYTNISVMLLQAGGTMDLKKIPLPHVIIGTTGMVSKLGKMRSKDLNEVAVLIVDEADFFLSNKEIPNLISLSKSMNNKKQVLLFSATYSEQALKNSQKVLGKEYLQLAIEAEKLTLKGVFQYFMKVDQKDKMETILNLYKSMTINQVIIFVNYKHVAKKLYDFLEANKISVSLLMGGDDMTKEQRDKIFDEFMQNKTRVFITTDLLSRGIDNRKISIVINYDLPTNHDNKDIKDIPNYEVYLHRIGRTGRFGDEGVALNLITNDAEMALLEKIKAFYKSEIVEGTVDMLEKKSKEIRGDKYAII
jgi:ATP-dependent RNA helicase DDX19/DBP5